jgi:hypothetical protein
LVNEAPWCQNIFSVCFWCWKGRTKQAGENQHQLRLIWTNYKQQKRSRRSGLTWHPFLFLARLQMITWQFNNSAECQLTTVKHFLKSQQKQIFRRLTQMKNKYLLESFWGFYCKCSREEPRLQILRLRITRVKILKSS